MQKRRFFSRPFLFILILLFVAILAVPTLADSVPISNAAFETGGSEGQPKNWQVKSYENQYVITTENGVVALSTEVADDLRIIQTVKVEPKTQYVFTAEMKIENVAGTGAGLSIDNYDLDQSCLYSTRECGTTDWMHVELAFITGENTKEVVLALRIGGYSEATSGTAYFRNVSLEQTNISSVSFQNLVPWGSSAQDDVDEDATSSEPARDAYWYKSVFSMFAMLTLLLGVFFLVGIQPNIDRINRAKWHSKAFWWMIGGTLLLAVLARYLLTIVFRGHPTDINCWISWGNTVATQGLATLYEGWCDYPPGYMIAVGVISKWQSILGISARSNIGLFGYMLPAIAADIGIAFFVLRMAKNQKLGAGLQYFLFAFVVLNPVAIFLSGAWSQIDSILTLFLILSFHSLYRNRRIFSGLFFALALLMKWQALMFGPVLAIAFFLSIRWQDETKRWNDILFTAIAVLSALVLVFLVSLLGMGEQGPFWFVQKFITAQSGYQYLSVEAYNALAFLGGNWQAIPEGWQGTMQILFGWFAVSLAVLGGAWILYKEFWRKRGNLFASEGSLYLAAAFCMYMIFTFSHYMHERYVFPVLFLLVLAYIFYKDKRLLLCAMLLTLSTFLNVTTAMYIHMESATAIVRGHVDHNMVVRFCSFMESIFFLHFSWVCYDLIKKKARESENFEQPNSLVQQGGQA